MAFRQPSHKLATAANSRELPGYIAKIHGGKSVYEHCEQRRYGFHKRGGSGWIASVHIITHWAEDGVHPGNARDLKISVGRVLFHMRMR